MRVISKGIPRVWTAQVLCTGAGNGGLGCNAALEVVAEDLRYFAGGGYLERDAEVCMACPECGRITSLDRGKWPPNYRELVEYTKAWAKGTPRPLWAGSVDEEHLIRSALVWGAWAGNISRDNSRHMAERQLSHAIFALIERFHVPLPKNPDAV